MPIIELTCCGIIFQVKIGIEQPILKRELGRIILQFGPSSKKHSYKSGRSRQEEKSKENRQKKTVNKPAMKGRHWVVGK